MAKKKKEPNKAKPKKTAKAVVKQAKKTTPATKPKKTGLLDKAKNLVKKAVSKKTTAKSKPVAPKKTIEVKKASKPKTETIPKSSTKKKKTDITSVTSSVDTAKLPSYKTDLTYYHLDDKVGTRKFFTHNDLEDFPLPNLIEVQLNSYNWFLNDGLNELLEEISPIQDFSGKKLELHFLNHSLGEPKYDPDTCRYKNLTFEAPLKVHVQLINKETGEIKEQDVFLGSIPLMTEKGSFIINGIERVVVSQIVRSPGVFFAKNPAAPQYHTAKIIPKRGAWLEIETDKKGVISVKIDRKRKIPVTSLLRIFGFETDEQKQSAYENMQAYIKQLNAISSNISS